MNYPPLFLAIIGAGGIYSGCNPAYTPNEIAHHLEITKARFLVADVDLLEQIADRVLECGLSPNHVFQMNNQGQDLMPNFLSYEDLLCHGEAMWLTFSGRREAETTTAALLSTSGTSGLPKAAKQSHQSFVSQAQILDDNAEKPYEVCVAQSHLHPAG